MFVGGSFWHRYPAPIPSLGLKIDPLRENCTADRRYLHGKEMTGSKKNWMRYFYLLSKVDFVAMKVEAVDVWTNPAGHDHLRNGCWNPTKKYPENYRSPLQDDLSISYLWSPSTNSVAVRTVLCGQDLEFPKMIHTCSICCQNYMPMTVVMTVATVAMFNYSSHKWFSWENLRTETLELVVETRASTVDFPINKLIEWHGPVTTSRNHFWLPELTDLVHHGMSCSRGVNLVSSCCSGAPRGGALLPVSPTNQDILIDICTYNI